MRGCSFYRARGSLTAGLAGVVKTISQKRKRRRGLSEASIRTSVQGAAVTAKATYRSMTFITIVVASSLAVLATTPSAFACEGLATLTIPNTTITAAQSIPAGTYTPPGGQPIPNLPAFCRVAATIKPTVDSNINVEMWLPPLGVWNQRFLGTGNGAFGGAIVYSALASGLTQNFAVINTDMGTFPAATAPNAGYQIAVGNPDMQVDWGWRSTRLMTIVGKQIARAFYGQEAKRSYFDGCSTGGHQALSEAQKFPHDYDGIYAGSPGNDRIPLHTYFLFEDWIPAVHPTMSVAPNLTTLVKTTALKTCVGKDGGLPTDSFLTDPRVCKFDPAVLQCTAEGQSNCLTPDQVKAVRESVAGPHNPRTGELIYPGWEHGTEGDIFTLATPSTATTAAADGIFRWVFGANWNFQTFNFDSDMAKVTDAVGTIINSNDADLSDFRAAGGKLLMTHGWADDIVVPRDTVFYYLRALREQRLPFTGLQQSVSTGALESSMRLFMVPGMGHCGGGPGPNTFDVLTPLTEWVEQDRAPNEIVATKYVNDQPADGVMMTRPLCPYPQQAHYNGTGDTNSATSFSCAVVEHNDPAHEEEKPAVEYRPPLAARATASPSLLSPENGRATVTVVLTPKTGSLDFRSWNISNLTAEGATAIAAHASDDGSSYTAVFRMSDLTTFMKQVAINTTVDMAITGQLVRDGNSSSFVTSAPVRVVAEPRR
jgi:feruloyl esterase